MSRHDRTIATTPVSPAGVPATPPAQKISRKKIVLGLVAVAALIGIGLEGHDYWTMGRFMVDTDDAYVTADITLISSRVQGYVAAVPVAQNAQVRAGDVLVQLDDGDYRIALETAQGRVQTAGETLHRIDAQIAAAQAGVAQAEAMQTVAEAQLRTARTTSDRIRQLASTKIAAQAQLDTAVERLDTAVAQLANAQAAVAAATAQVGVLQAQRAEAEGTRHEFELAVAQAQRNLDLTVLRAPADGTLANLTLEVGDLVTPGARLAALVPLQSLYVEANFKETQLDRVALGATVEMSFDAIPGETFEGHVASIAPATGSVFSLLPAENATGNFTKVVQRVPVRIALPEDPRLAGHLRAGLSVVVEVDSRTGASNLLAAAE